MERHIAERRESLDDNLGRRIASNDVRVWRSQHKARTSLLNRQVQALKCFVQDGANLSASTL